MSTQGFKIPQAPHPGLANFSLRLGIVNSWKSRDVRGIVSCIKKINNPWLTKLFHEGVILFLPTYHQFIGQYICNHYSQRSSWKRICFTLIYSAGKIKWTAKTFLYMHMFNPFDVLIS